MKIDEVLIVSDMDGTLIGKDFTIPQRNIEAVKKFQKLGGHFAMATGRSISSCGRYTHLVSPNAPCVLLNGSLIYDFSLKKTIQMLPLPIESEEYIQKIHSQFPSAGTAIYTENGIYIYRGNTYIDGLVSHEKMEAEEYPKAGIFPWAKALSAAESDVKEQMMEFVKGLPSKGVRFVSSSEYYLEMLPENADKGSGLKVVAKSLEKTPKVVFGIGDYYNDIELLKAADIAVVPQNAPEDIKSMADLVVGHCYTGAVADLIDYILEKAE